MLSNLSSVVLRETEQLCAHSPINGNRMEDSLRLISPYPRVIPGLSPEHCSLPLSLTVSSAGYDAETDVHRGIPGGVVGVYTRVYREGT